jgi:D-beta-D-heptose 7-phosphate kinase / D-beta-D-heptose 1-phosphate adenosyltransferase
MPPVRSHTSPERVVDPVGSVHLSRLNAALTGLDMPRIAAWGRRLAVLGRSGHRLLAAGNGGSAAQAQHLTAELVGRFETERIPLSALALHAETSTVTAVSNDFGYEQVFARQVRAHGRPGDVLLALSCSGRSPNLLRAAETARQAGVTTWALTGAAPNPLAALADETIAVPSARASTVQECHLVAIHLICTFLDAVLAGPAGSEPSPPAARPHGQS